MVNSVKSAMVNIVNSGIIMRIIVVLNLNIVEVETVGFARFPVVLPETFQPLDLILLWVELVG